MIITCSLPKQLQLSTPPPDPRVSPFPAPPHALQRRATPSSTMDTLAEADFDKLPFFFTTLYEKEALKLKEGQSEDWLDDDLRANALAQGLCDIDLELPVRPPSARLPPTPIDPHPQQNAPDVLGPTASPLRRSSVSGNTQASCSTDITTPDSPASADDHDRSFAASPTQRHSMSAAPHPVNYSRHSTSSLASYRSPKPRFFRRMSSFGKKYFRYVT